MKYDCIIIGSGISGLSAALILALNGKKVAIIEKNNRTALLLRQYQRQGVWCNPGFHYTGGFKPSGFLSVFFRYLGLYDRIQTLSMDPEKYDIVSVSEGKDFCFPIGLERVRDSLCERFPRSREIINKYIEYIEVINKKTFFLNCNLDFGKHPRDLLNNDTLREFLQKGGAEEGLIQLLGNYGYSLYGSHDFEVPFYLHAWVIGEFYQSANTVIRGGDAIAEAFDARCREEGVDFYLGQPAISLKIDDNHCLKGVVVEGGNVIESDNCICTIHPQLLEDIGPKNDKFSSFYKRLKDFDNTYSPFVIHLKTEKIPKKIVNSNYYSLDNLNSKNFIGIMSNNQDKMESGKKSITVISSCCQKQLSQIFDEKNQNFDNIYADLKRKETEKIFQSVMTIFPELKGNCQIVDSASPLTYQRYTGTVNGSIYGIKQTVKQSSLSSVTPIKGLFLAGQSIKVPGIMGSVVSSFLSVLNILEPKQLWEKVQKCL